MTANGLRVVDDGREQAWPPQRYEAEDDGILVLPLVWTHYATGTSSHHNTLALMDALAFFLCGQTTVSLADD